MASRNKKVSKCKYCKQRFAGNIPRFLSHLRSHKRCITPYWYGDPRLPPKVGCVDKLLCKLKRRGDMKSPAKNSQKSVVAKSVDIHKVMCSAKGLSLLVGKKGHEPKQPYKCRYCDECFSQASNKKMHE